MYPVLFALIVCLFLSFMSYYIEGMKEELPKIRNFKSFEGFVREVRPTDREHNLVIAVRLA